VFHLLPEVTDKANIPGDSRQYARRKLRRIMFRWEYNEQFQI